MSRLDMTTYGKLSTRFYDQCFPEAPIDALSFYVECAQRSRGPILEPMCGSGRYLLPLLAQGYDIQGSDASEEMLARCEQRARDLGLSPRLRQSTLQQLSHTREFGLILIPAGSFCLVTDQDEVRGCLHRIHKALVPGGSLVVEVERQGSLEPTLDSTWNGRWLKEPDGTLIVQSVLHQYSGIEGIARALHRYEVVVNGRLIDAEFEELAVRHYEREEFASLLSEAGFRELECFAPHERRPPNDEDEGLLFECRA